MYEIYCDELKRRSKKKNKTKISKVIQNNMKFLSRKKKIEFFTDSELKDSYLDKLKLHLHLNLDKRYIKARECELVIDLTSNFTQNEDNFTKEESDKENENVTVKRIKSNQLIMPKME